MAGKNEYQKWVWSEVKQFLAKIKEDLDKFTPEEANKEEDRELLLAHKLWGTIFHDTRNKYARHDTRNKYARVKIPVIQYSMRHKIASVGALLDWLDENEIPHEMTGGGWYRGLTLKIPLKKGEPT
jgi:hypothetical protein